MESVIGVDHLIDRCYVHWDITTKCNMDCSYCYAKKEYNNDWQKESKLRDIDAVLQSIKLSTLPIFLGLLGGEPTISKHFNYIIRELNRSGFFEKNNRLYVVSNGQKPLQKVIRYLKDSDYYNNKLFWLLSYHPSQDPDDNIFIQCANELISMGYKVKINFMLDPDLPFNELKKMTLVKDRLKKEALIHWHYVYVNEHELAEYPEEVFEYFDKIIDQPKEFLADGVLVSDSWLLDQKFNRNNFKGWNCWLNNYEIDFRGNLVKFCTGEKTNLLDDIFFFRKIKKIIPIICKWDKCSCDGLLKIKKCSNKKSL